MNTASRQIVCCIAAVLAASVAMIVLYRYAPSEHGFYPRCIFHAVTGWACPGCGSLRAAHSFLHGEFGQAFRFNPMMFVLLPATALAWLGYRKSGLSALPAAWIWVTLSIILAFGVLRNLPVAPFSHWNP